MNLPYHAARLEGKMTRALYQMALPSIAGREIRVARDLPFEVFSYSGERMLPEQVASIRSFLANAGRPRQFTVVSDGSHRQSSIKLLEKIDACVRVDQTPPVPEASLPEKVKSYLETHPTGKQLAVIMSLPINGPTLYSDSDVLFFQCAHELAELANVRSASAFYLADYQFAGDERLISDPSEMRNPANTGFLFLFQKLDWSVGLRRLAELRGEPTFFTNQTVTHLCLHANGATSFDAEKFVLKTDDEFIYRDRHAGPGIAMRHYVNQIRHKFWTPLARRF